MGPAILLTIGVLFLLDNVSDVEFRQNLAGHPAGDRRGEADAEQCFLRRARRPVAAGSIGLSASAATECANGVFRDIPGEPETPAQSTILHLAR